MITTEAKIESYLLTNIDGSFSLSIESWISAVSEYIDNITGRQIIADSSESTYKYSGDGTDILFIDDFISISEVTIDGVATTDYFTHPINPSHANPTPATWMLIGDGITWTEGTQNISVTGIRGFVADGSVPADLEWAATVIAAQIVLTAKNEGVTQNIKAEKIGQWDVEFYNESEINDYKRALDMIEKYKKFTKYAV
jgi:hypothetical protein